MTCTETIRGVLGELMLFFSTAMLFAAMLFAAIAAAILAVEENDRQGYISIGTSLTLAAASLYTARTFLEGV